MRTTKCFIMALVLTALLTSAQAATITNSVSGYWSNTAIWSGGVAPGTGDTAVIKGGTTVRIDSPTVTVFQINIQNTGTLIMDGSSATGDSQSHTIKFTDNASAGFVGAYGGWLTLRGDAAHTQYVTTAASGAPANYWSLNLGITASAHTLDFDFTVFSYFKTPQANGSPAVSIDNCIFSHSADQCFNYYGNTLGSYSNNILEYNASANFTMTLVAHVCPSIMENVVIRNPGGVNQQLNVSGASTPTKWEFRNSNFEISMTTTGTYLKTSAGVTQLCALVSQNHNDVPGDYRLILASTLAETNLMLKFDKQNLTYTATVRQGSAGAPYHSATLTVDRAITVGSLNMGTNCYLDLSAGKNIYYLNTATYTPANIIGPGQVLKVPTGTIFSLR